MGENEKIFLYKRILSESYFKKEGTEKLWVLKRRQFVRIVFLIWLLISSLILILGIIALSVFMYSSAPNSLGSTINFVGGFTVLVIIQVIVAFSFYTEEGKVKANDKGVEFDFPVRLVNIPLFFNRKKIKIVSKLDYLEVKIYTPGTQYGTNFLYWSVKRKTLKFVFENNEVVELPETNLTSFLGKPNNFSDEELKKIADFFEVPLKPSQHKL